MEPNCIALQQSIEAYRAEERKLVERFLEFGAETAQEIENNTTEFNGHKALGKLVREFFLHVLDRVLSGKRLAFEEFNDLEFESAMGELRVEVGEILMEVDDPFGKVSQNEREIEERILGHTLDALKNRVEWARVRVLKAF